MVQREEEGRAERSRDKVAGSSRVVQTVPPTRLPRSTHQQVGTSCKPCFDQRSGGCSKTSHQLTLLIWLCSRDQDSAFALLHIHRHSSRRPTFREFTVLLAIQYHYPQSTATARSSPARILFPGSIHSSHVMPTMRLVQIRPFSTSGPALDDSGLHFDTHRFVEKLESQGFSREQSEAIMNALDEVITDR